MSGDNSRQKKDRTPLRILFIAPAMPAETGNGLAMRAGQFLDGLSRQFEVDLAVLIEVSNGEFGDRLARIRGHREELVLFLPRPLQGWVIHVQ